MSTSIGSLWFTCATFEAVWGFDLSTFQLPYWNKDLASPVNRICKKTFPSQRRCRKADPLPTPVPTPRLPPVATQRAAIPTFPRLILSSILPLLPLRTSCYSPVLPTPFAFARYLRLYLFTLVINSCLLFVILVCSVFPYCGPASLTHSSLSRPLPGRISTQIRTGVTIKVPRKC